MRKLLFSLIASRLLSRSGHAGRAGAPAGTPAMLLLSRLLGRRAAGRPVSRSGSSGGRLRSLLSAFLAARRLKLGKAQTLRHLVHSQLGAGRRV